MTRVLGPERVPRRLHHHHRGVRGLHARRPRRSPTGWPSEVAAALEALEAQAGKRLGDPEDPLLVSVRSGARESMPGMMDTVLNLGLNDDSVEGLAARTGNPRFAWDAYRRFVQMFGNVVPRRAGRAVRGRRSGASRRTRGVERDTELDEDALRELTRGVPGASTSSRRTRGSSCARPSAPSSTPGWASAPSPTGASTTSPTSGARPATCSRWCSATRATRRAPAWRSRATR